MSTISSVSAPPPVQPLAVSDPTPPAASTNSDADAGRADASQPAVLAPLPPGQGTRIDQIA